MKKRAKAEFLGIRNTIVRRRLRTDMFPSVYEKRDNVGQFGHRNVPRASNASRSFSRTRRCPRPLGDGRRIAGNKPDLIQRFMVLVLTEARVEACATESQFDDCGGCW